MAYETPTAADLIARYPAFAAVPEATINVHLADAARDAADTSWPEQYFAPAVVAFAAHQMMLLGIGNHGEASDYARGGVTDLWSGDFRVKFAEKHAATASSGTLKSTPYGQAYSVLLRRAKGGPRLVGGGIMPGGWGPTAQQNNGMLLPGGEPWDF